MSIPNELREKLMEKINPPFQHPIFQEVAEAQRWNPEAMDEKTLSDLQNHGWFKGYEFKQEVYDQHQKELYEAMDRTYPDPEPTPEQKAKDLERKKMITQVVGADWKYEDESLDQYKFRKYGIPVPITEGTEQPTPNVQTTQQPRQPDRRTYRKRGKNRSRNEEGGSNASNKFG